ncbi:WD repeat-containing protein 73 [Synchiropus splendidus]|uniref:WD repeat-containing protein 73 n=1 Tax=Synchiropus splendidus TaxID=270530 RepID=UPI00237D608A|nr:WD repeat-containing protein 73 [Synchiropus splendidus]
MEDLEEAEDGWFFDSLTKYQDLHMYQLEGPANVLEWTSPQTVCVAGQHGNSSQILELQLPLKLLVEVNKGLCAERDFRVTCGAFTDAPVSGLKHVTGTRCVVTSGGQSSDLQLWDLSEEAGGSIKSTGSVPGVTRHSGGGNIKMAVRPCMPEVVHGAQSDDVVLSSLTTGKTLSHHVLAPAAELLASLHFVSQDVVLAACFNGSVYVMDTRASGPAQVHSQTAGDQWWTAVSAGSDLSSCELIQLSGSGLAVIWDLRSPPASKRHAQLDVQSISSDSEHVHVSWAPALDNTISVSGFGGNILIYDSSNWGAEPHHVRPQFEHRGHMVSNGLTTPHSVMVTAHIWHTVRPRTLLSAASDGSAHLWDWISQSATKESSDPH